jgi:hypothetical protein
VSAPTFYEHSPVFTKGLFASDNGGPDSQTRSAIGGFPCRVKRAMMAAVDAPRHVRRRCVIGVRRIIIAGNEPSRAGAATESTGGESVTEGISIVAQELGADEGVGISTNRCAALDHGDRRRRSAWREPCNHFDRPRPDRDPAVVGIADFGTNPGRHHLHPSGTHFGGCRRHRHPHATRTSLTAKRDACCRRAASASLTRHAR